MDHARKLYILFLPLFHWPELSQMSTYSCKGCWEMLASCEHARQASSWSLSHQCLPATW